MRTCGLVSSVRPPHLSAATGLNIQYRAGLNLTRDPGIEWRGATDCYCVPAMGAAVDGPNLQASERKLKSGRRCTLNIRSFALALVSSFCIMLFLRSVALVGCAAHVFSKPLNAPVVRSRQDGGPLSAEQTVCGDLIVAARNSKVSTI
jgi:hypothetical protein